MEINADLNESKDGNLNKISTDILHTCIPTLACVCDVVCSRSEHYLNKYTIPGVQNHQGFQEGPVSTDTSIGSAIQKKKHPN